MDNGNIPGPRTKPLIFIDTKYLFKIIRKLSYSKCVLYSIYQLQSYEILHVSFF